MPKNCHLALLNAISKPRFKFTAVDEDDEEETEANPVPPTQEPTDGDSTENEDGSEDESSSEASISIIAPKSPPPVAKKAPRKNSVKRKIETESPKKPKKPKKAN